MERDLGSKTHSEGILEAEDVAGATWLLACEETRAA